MTLPRVRRPFMSIVSPQTNPANNISGKPGPLRCEIRRKKEEGRRKKEEGRRKKEEGRRKKEEGRRERLRLRLRLRRGLRARLRLRVGGQRTCPPTLTLNLALNPLLNLNLNLSLLPSSFFSRRKKPIDLSGQPGFFAFKGRGAGERVSLPQRNRDRGSVNLLRKFPSCSISQLEVIPCL